MQFIRGFHNLNQQHQGCALTIGNFDGLHLGHQALLQLLAEVADKQQLPRCMMTFEPLPHEFFSHKNTVPRLMNVREKLIALADGEQYLCPDYVLLIPFNQWLSDMSAADFVETILVAKLAIKALVIGDDFRFGCDRKGDLAMLQSMGKKYGFEVETLSTHQVKNLRVSSTRIRDALAEDNLDEAAHMLGRRYQICGRVAHGDKRGRSIGFPTANIKLKRPLTSLSGVYSVTMQTKNQASFAGVANVGRRPTVAGENIQLEVHLFDFDRDIYGQNVCVSFHQKIRDEQRFESLEALKEQIQLDCEKAKKQLTMNN